MQNRPITESLFVPVSAFFSLNTLISLNWLRRKLNLKSFFSCFFFSSDFQIFCFPGSVKTTCKLISLKITFVLISNIYLDLLPYNPYLAHRALSKLEFPIGNIYCIIPKERTPQPLTSVINYCYFNFLWSGTGTESNIFCCNLKQFDKRFIKSSKILDHEKKKNHVFLFKKVGVR